MSKIVLKHVLEKHFGKNNESIKYAIQEIDAIYKNTLNNIVETPENTINSEYESADIFYPIHNNYSNKNLDKNDYCIYCDMIWYNCLCSHYD